MKLLPFPLFLYVFIFISYSGMSQEYVDTLEPIYLTPVKNISQSARPFVEVNDYLIKTTLSINKSIKIAKQFPEDIVLIKNEHVIILDKATYLKVLKSAANKNDTTTSFVNAILELFPTLKEVLHSYNKIDDLYARVRNETLNGKLDAIPTSLQWI